MVIDAEVRPSPITRHINGYKVTADYGKGALSLTVITPGDDRAIGLQAQTVIPACGYRYEIVSVRRSSLTIMVVAPDDDRAVGLQSQTVAASCCYRNKIVPIW